MRHDKAPKILFYRAKDHQPNSCDICRTANTANSRRFRLASNVFFAKSSKAVVAYRNPTTSYF